MRYLLFTSAIAILFLSCKKENTVWETDWSAPVIDDRLTLENLVNDSTLDVNGGYYDVDLTRTLVDISVNELITIPDTTIHKEYGITFPFISVPPNFTFFNVESENVMAIPDVELKQIMTKKGFIDITVKNPAATKAFFNVQLVGVMKDGAQFSQTFEAEAGTAANPGIVTGTIDLSGYSFDLMGLNGNQRNVLTSRVTVTSDPDGSTITLSNSDIVKVDVTLRDIEISYARGYFGNQIISDTTNVSLDVMNMIQSGAIDLPASSITFEIENGLKVGASALLTNLTSTNASGTSVSLTHPQIGTPFLIDPATGAWGSLTPSVRQLTFDANNSNIEAYLENLGASNDLGFQVELNPWGNISSGADEMFPASRVKVKMHATLPLKLGFDDLVVRDTFEVDLSQNSSATQVKSGEFLLKAENAFPFSADVKLILLDANQGILHTITGSEKIESAEFGAYDALIGLNVKTSNVEFSLPEAIVSDLANIKYIIVESKFNSINPSTSLSEAYHVPMGAYLGVKLRTRFTTENQF